MAAYRLTRSTRLGRGRAVALDMPPPNRGSQAHLASCARCWTSQHSGASRRSPYWSRQGNAHSFCRLCVVYVCGLCVPRLLARKQLDDDELDLTLVLLMMMLFDARCCVVQWRATRGGLNNAIDLVRLIRKEHGDWFCVAVAGYVPNRGCVMASLPSQRFSPFPEAVNVSMCPSACMPPMCVWRAGTQKLTLSAGIRRTCHLPSKP